MSRSRNASSICLSPLSNRARVTVVTVCRYAADGRPYYVDHNTQRTHWEHPNPAVAPSAPALDPEEASAGGTQVRCNCFIFRSKA